MKTHTIHHAFKLSLTAVAAAFVCAPALADEVSDLTRLDKEITVTWGHTKDDGRRFGSYSGMSERGGYFAVDGQYTSRNDQGLWNRLYFDLGRSSGGAGLEFEKQGVMGLSLDLQRILRHDPKSYNIVGSTANAGLPLIVRGTQSQVQLKRDRGSLAAFYTISPGVAAQVKYSHEHKAGFRNAGIAGTFAFEPIDFTSQQFDASINYTGKTLQLVAGYSGSAFSNANSTLAVDIKNGAGAITTWNRLALSPDNSAHQVYLTGGYSFSKDTRANAKVAFTRGIQEKAFDDRVLANAQGTPPLAKLPGIGANLGGQLDTILVQAGLNHRFSQDLSLNGQFRFEDRDDKTPQRTFVRTSATTVRDNTPLDNRWINGKVDATYRGFAGYALVAGLGYEQRDRSVLSDNAYSITQPDGSIFEIDYRQISWRAQNQEATAKLEIRKSLSDWVNGTLQYQHAKRDGSDFLLSGASGGTGTAVGSIGVIAPIHFADRSRNKLRLSLDATPVESLSLQVMLEGSADDYTGQPFANSPQANLGPQKGQQALLSVDLSYNLSDDVLLGLWASGDRYKLQQRTYGSSTQWQSDLETQGDAFGMSLEGRVNASTTFGVKGHTLKNQMSYELTRILGTAAVAPLNPVEVRQSQFNLFGTYQINKRMGLRADFIHDRYNSDDWQWDRPYGDVPTGSPAGTAGTTVNPHQRAKVNYFGISLVMNID